MTEASHAVFLSYASQDAEAAQRICEALRLAGIEVWFDKSELRGGDAWDQSIRRQIKNCALFIPVISKNTDARAEGYFRLEWKLAVDRSHLFTSTKAFLVPVAIDDTADDDEQVPDRFRELQWTRLSAGETSPAFVERVQRLLSGETAIQSRPHAPSTPGPRRLGFEAPTTDRRQCDRSGRGGLSRHRKALVLEACGGVRGGLAPPPHSVAVLPFVNMSGDKEQEYFSDGLTEELLNSLAQVNELQVAGRTSAFSFKGKDTDIATIARKLNVAAVLEGSVRRSGNMIRISTELINTVTGFQLWSKSYDRDLGDVLKLQTEIATAVASALKVTLLGDIAAKVELGGTRNPAAFDAYLRGAKARSSMRDTKDLPAAIAAYTEAIRLDPHYALAFAARSVALSYVAGDAETVAAVREGYDKAQADARQALALAPDLAQTHLALAFVAEGILNFPQASESYERALALAPGNAEVLRISGAFADSMGHFDVGIAAARRAVVLDPLARLSHFDLGMALYAARRYEEAIAAYAEVISLAPDYKEGYGYRGLAYYGLGDLKSARGSCETTPDYWASQWCLSVVYGKLGRRADAEAELSKIKAALSDTMAYQYATIYAQWGNRAQALEWLATALRLRDPGLVYLKTDPLMDSLRREPRFQTVMRELKFPS